MKTKQIDSAEMAAQREIVAAYIARAAGNPGMPFAHIGRTWHTSRRATYGVRFATTAELVSVELEHGGTWEPLEAVATGGAS